VSELNYASAAGHDGLVKQLLLAGADVNIKAETFQLVC